MKKNLRSNELQKAKQVSGNVLTELNEAELGSISGAGEVRGSNGGFCARKNQGAVIRFCAFFRTFS